MYLGGNPAPASQTVGSLLRIPWPLNQPKKWSEHSSNHYFFRFANIVSDPQMKHPFMFNQFIAMITSHQIIRAFMWNIYRKDEVGNRPEAPERETESSRLVVQEKERWLNLEMAWVIEMTGSKLSIWVFLSIQINRTNKLSIKKSDPQIILLIWGHILVVCSPPMNKLWAT